MNFISNKSLGITFLHPGIMENIFERFEDKGPYAMSTFPNESPHFV